MTNYENQHSNCRDYRRIINPCSARLCCELFDLNMEPLNTKQTSAIVIGFILVAFAAVVVSLIL